MDWLTFWVSLLKTILSWPVAFVVIVWLLRKPIKGILNRLKQQISRMSSLTIAYKKTKVRMAMRKEDAEIQEIAKEQTAESVPQRVTTPMTLPGWPQPSEYYQELDLATEIAERFATLFKTSPEAAMIDAYRYLEGALRGVVQRLSLPIPVNSPPIEIAQKLREMRLITVEQFRMIVAFTSARNKAEHGLPNKTIKAIDTVHFLALIDTVIRYLYSLTPESPKVPPEPK